MQNPPDDMALQKQLLDELMEYARGGMGADLKARYAPQEEVPAEEPPAEDPEIPGVEASEEAPPSGEEPQLDAAKLKALLASMGG